MANLPTAYASQNFGRKTLDFYAAAGEVSGSDPRARADEHSLTDYDGAKHTVRVMDRDFVLEAGDQASVLRMQTGPSHRSRPVAVVNHTRQGWSRTHPGASAMLSRAGVARNVNWFLTVILFALAAMVMVWPYLRTFLVEVDPVLFGAAPSFDIFALALSALPDLGNWSFSQTVSPVSALIAQSLPSMAGQADQIVFYALSGLAALIVFATRSWRLLWAPLFVGLVAAAALGLGGVEAAAGYAVAAYGLSAVIFVIGGLINRIRDAARLERRIALLADHLQRHAPEETIARTEAPEAEAETETVESAEETADTASMTAVATPVSAALSETPAEPEAPAADAAAPDLSEDSEVVAAESDAMNEMADGEDDAVLADSAVEAIDPETEDPDTVDDDLAAAQDALTEPEAAVEPVAQAEAEVDSESDTETKAEAQAEAEVDAETETETEAEAGTDVGDSNQDDAEPEDQAEVISSEAEPAEPALLEGDEVSDDAITAETPAEDETKPVSEADASVAADDASVAADAQTVQEAVETDEAVEAEADLEAEDETSVDPNTLISEDADEVDSALTLPDAEAGASETAPEGEAELAGLEAEEVERMKNDPRYAARAIVLPSPPPMPSEEDSETVKTAQAQPTTRETRELRPSAPLTNRVMSLFSNPVVPPAPPAPPAPSRAQEDENA